MQKSQIVVWLHLKLIRLKNVEKKNLFNASIIKKLKDSTEMNEKQLQLRLKVHQN